MKGLTMPTNPQIHSNEARGAQENEVAARVTRRRFTAEQKARILEEYEHASAIEKAAICRREHIYSSHISNWRKQRASGKPLEAKRGRKPEPLAVENTRLRKRTIDLEQRLAKAEQVIDVQGKVYALLRAVAGESADQMDLPPWQKR
jgi:transposase